MTSPKDIIRELCTLSEARLPLPDHAAVRAALHPEEPIGGLERVLYDQLAPMLVSSIRTNFDSHDLRAVGAAFELEHAGGGDRDWSDVISAIAACIPAGTFLREPIRADPTWLKALDIARALVVLGVYRHRNQRISAVAAAGARLRERGFQIRVEGSCFVFAEGEMERATEQILSTLARCGQVGALGNLFRILRETDRSAFGVYLPVREYNLDRREGSYPFGFLVNLAVRAPAEGIGLEDGSPLWREALNLARDMVGVLDLEPYHAFEIIDPSPLRIEEKLRELALYDHLFSLRQWPLDLAPLILREFFADDFRDEMQSSLGWHVGNMISLLEALSHFATRDPNVITRAALATGGIEADLLQRMLQFFVHSEGTVNAAYNHPLAAQNADMQFKPLVEIGSRRYLVPAASLIGPAFYEATMNALRPIIGLDRANDLTGVGTERVVAALLRRAGLNVTVAGAHYDLGSGDDGECDLVVETENRILLIECKAKPLTRGSMAGVLGDALLDFAGGTFAAQTQALRHERILRTRDRIDFDDGNPSLERRGREITRLSVTLLDHGALQDRMVLVNFYEALLRMGVSVAPGYPKAGQVKKFGDLLAKLRAETEALVEAGVPVREQALAGATLSVVQLAVLLDGIANLEQFVRRATKRVSYMSLNALYEFYLLKREGHVE